MDRFSPYYEHPESFGMVNVHPMAAYRYIYPFPEESLHRIAYYFDYDYARSSDPRGFAAEAIADAERWRQQLETGNLWSVLTPDSSIVLMDTRTSAVRAQASLSGLERAVYEFCDEVHSAAAVARKLRIAFPDERFTDQEVKGFLESMVANRFMVTAGVDYLSLAIPTYALEEVLEARQQALRPPPAQPALAELRVL